MRKKLFISVLLIFCSSFFTELLSQSAICNYKYRKRIAFNPAQVTGPSDLSNYPALIKIVSDNDLRTVANSGHVESANGYDIIFTAADGITKLDHQLEKYTATTGELITFVRIPSLSTTYTTYIYMYYGNTAIIADQSLTTTWSTNYKGVYFLHNDFTDKSGNGNNGTNNSMTAALTGTIANGVSSNSVNDYVSIGTSGWSSSAGTFEMWVNSTGAWNAAEAYFLGHTTLAAYNNRVQIYGFNGRLRVGMGSSHAIGGDLFTFNTARWYHVAVMYSSGSHTVCVNGATVYVGTYSALSAIGQADIGNNGNNHTEAMAAGGYDNFFIENTARDVNWINTVYRNQSSPSTFYTISAEPKVWTGGTNTNYNAATNWLNNSTPAGGNDVIINNGTNQPTLQGNEQVGSIWIRTGAVLSLGNNSLSVRYDITNCGTLSNNTGTVNCNSTSSFIQNQYFSGSGTYNLKGLTVNNTHSASPSLILSKNITVNGTLTLASGIVYSSATNILAVSNTGVSTSGLAASFVSGPMSKNGATDFIFPVGKGTKWRRCAVTNISASDTYTAEYFNSSYASSTPVNAPLNHVSVVEYWQVDRAGAGNARLTLYWEDAGVSGITNCPDLTIARWNGASWDERIGTASGSCAGAGAGSIITNAQLTAFSPFTFGSHLSWAVNPLPITLLTFTATPISKNKALVEWSTATEKNNDHFEIERTIDGKNFELVGKQNGNGNSNSKRNYSLFDHQPHKGLSYYRLKQVDVNGDFSYSSLVSVNFDEAHELNYSLFPNPNKGEFTINGNVEGAEVIIYNAIGQKVEFAVGSKTPMSMIVNCSSLASGIYFVNIKRGGETKVEKLIIE